MSKGRYVMDSGEKFVGMAPHPYAKLATPGWPSAVLTPGSQVARQPGALSGWNEMSGTTKLLVVVGVGLLLFFILKNSGLLVKKNPGGRNKVAKVFKTTSGWWFKLANRKKAKRYGPFNSECAAEEAASEKGWGVLS